MIVDAWLKQATNILGQSGILTARLDALVLLEDTTLQARSWLLAHPDSKLEASQLKILQTHIKRRQTHEPLAYIREHVEFYGRTFMVNDHVLVPRPESETMVDLLKDLQVPSTPHIRIADVGTGCGAIGITAALELPESTVHLYDIDPDALAVAAHNAQQFNLNLQYYSRDLLGDDTGDTYTVILANLPYVPNSFPVNAAAQFEPSLALYGGDDGLDLYRRLFKQLGRLKHPAKYVLTESLPQQHKALSVIAAVTGYNVQKTDDFIQVFCLN